MAYAGKILRVDLSSGRTRSEPLPEKWARDYLGGKGLAIKYLYEELAPGTGPLSPANKLVLMTGPKEMQDDNSAKFSAIFCDFWAVSDAVQAEILSLVLGRSVTIEELKKIGERINNLARLFNQREGFAAKDDTLPARIFTEKLPSGPSAGRLLPRGEFDKMLAEYYSLCGWDEAGRVTEVKIKELGL